MNVLIVDDEAGIREGMAAFLRLQGMTVVTADSVAAGRERLAAGAYDAVVSDWQLGDGVAAALLREVDVPCFVVSGHPESVVTDDCPGPVQVLAKPLMPNRLAELLRAALETETQSDAQTADPADAATQLSSLPIDVRERVELVTALCGGDGVEILDDGEFVSVAAALESEATLPALEALGGDLRVLSPAQGLRFEQRWYRNGRPDDTRVVGLDGGDWPESGAAAIDLDRESVSPSEFLDLLDRIEESSASITLLNVPGSLRLYVVALGRAAQLPMKEVPGPRIPAVLSQLWS